MSKVTAKYQITIPVEVRKELGIIPGSEVDITRKNDRYILVVNPVREIMRKWRGRFKDGIKSDTYMNEIRGKAD